MAASATPVGPTDPGPWRYEWRVCISDVNDVPGLLAGITYARFKDCIKISIVYHRICVVKALMAHIPWPERKQDFLDFTLGFAAMCGDLAITEYALTSGADVHAVKDQAIRFAAKYGQSYVLQYLVENEADVYALENSPRHVDVADYIETVIAHRTLLSRIRELYAAIHYLPLPSLVIYNIAIAMDARFGRYTWEDLSRYIKDPSTFTVEMVR